MTSPLTETGTPVAETELQTVVPHATISENDADVRVTILLPGVSRDKLDISVENNNLRVSGEMRYSTPDGMTLRHSEFAPVRFSRDFKLSDGIDRENIHAKLTDGELVIKLQRVPKMQPRKIEISAN
jgi:HSP20 family molecular chaperone IbpA